MIGKSARALGAIVHKIRRELLMTLGQLGGEVGAAPATVCRWEYGGSLPDKGHLEALQRLAPGYADELAALWGTGRDEVSEHLKALRGKGVE